MSHKNTFLNPIKIALFLLLTIVVFTCKFFGLDLFNKEQYPKLQILGFIKNISNFQVAHADTPYLQSSYGSYSQSGYYSQSSYGSYSQSSYRSYSQSGYYSQSSYRSYSQSGYYSQSSYASSGGSGGSCGGSCFTAGEVVLTEDGGVSIERVCVGAKVRSYDEESEEFVTSTVGEVIIHDEQTNPHDFVNMPLVELTCSDGSITRVTSNHPYYDVVSGAYKAIGEFNIGDSLFTQSGPIKIISRDVLTESSVIATVYNLHMSSGPANYFVNGILVHNKFGM